MVVAIIIDPVRCSVACRYQDKYRHLLKEMSGARASLYPARLKSD
jgi:hypothetical protein